MNTLQPCTAWIDVCDLLCFAVAIPQDSQRNALCTSARQTLVARPGHTNALLNFSKLPKSPVYVPTSDRITTIQGASKWYSGSSLLSTPSHMAWMTATCPLLAGISYWLQWSHYSALFSLPRPHIPTLWGILGGTDIAGVAILAIRQDIQAQDFPSMPSNGNALWYKKEASNWVREYLPIGNGYLGGESFCSIITRSYYLNASLLAAMVSGGVISEQLSLNIDSMWSGGPFQNNVSALYLLASECTITWLLELHWWQQAARRRRSCGTSPHSIPS